MSRSFASSLAMATLIGLFALGGCAVTDVHRSAPWTPMHAGRCCRSPTTPKRRWPDDAPNPA